MTIKKYRICIFLVLVLIVSCSVCFYYWKESEKSSYEDGVLVERDCQQQSDERQDKSGIKNASATKMGEGEQEPWA